jgi:hypothetical protein
MAKNTLPKKKLTLARETLRALARPHLLGVRGGNDVSWWPPCDPAVGVSRTCPSGSHG